MGSIQNPIGGGPRDPYEGYRVEPIEGERHTKDDPEKKPESKELPNKQSVLLGYFFNLFHKLFALFPGAFEKKKTAPSQGPEKEILENLLFLKAVFEMMKKEERSQDIGFLNRFSKIWQKFLEDALRINRSSETVKEMRSLIDAIQHYPERQQHSLGYYLSEYAGQKWLPFPYMEMIQKIHAEHLKNPTESALAQWTHRIDRLLSLLKSEPEPLSS